MTKNRLLACLLVFVMCCSLLVGCTNTEPPVDGGNDAVTDTDVDTPSVEDIVDSLTQSGEDDSDVVDVLKEIWYEDIDNIMFELPAVFTEDPFMGLKSSLVLEEDGSLLLTFYPLDDTIDAVVATLSTASVTPDGEGVVSETPSTNGADASVDSTDPDASAEKDGSEEVVTTSASGDSESEGDSILDTLLDPLLDAAVDAAADALRDAIESLLEVPFPKRLPNSLDARYIFQFPHGYDIVMISGMSECVSLVGASAVIDTSDVLNTYDGTPFVFRATPRDVLWSVPEDLESPFEDVPVDMWCFPAVYAAFEAGVAETVDEGIFAPTANLTIAQMCQIYAKAAGMDVGMYDGYWAAGAITSCLDAGIIPSHGPISPKYYDVPVTRQEAAAGLARTYLLMHPDALEGKTLIKLSALPDGSLISGEFVESVQVAYTLRLIHGKDAAGTLAPFDTITRAEICQIIWLAGIV